MMLVEIFLFAFLSFELVTTADAFVLGSYLPKASPLVVLCETFAIRTATRMHDDTNPGDTTTTTTVVDPRLIALQHEYKILQEKLLKDVVLAHDLDDAEIVQEHMIEIAQQAAKIHKEHQKEILRNAEHTVEEAQATRQRLQELREPETAMGLDTVHHMNDDVFDQLAVYNDLTELAAKNKVAVAKTLLGHLQDNEKKLHTTLEQVKKEHGGHKSRTLVETRSREPSWPIRIS